MNAEKPKSRQNFKNETMKSVKILSAILFCVFCMSSNAQVFVGGNLGFSSGSDKTKDNGMTIVSSSNSNFSFSPMAGKFLSEKFAIGAVLNISLSGSSSGVNPGTTVSNSSLGGGFFARYYALRWKSFSVFAQGNAGVSFSASNTKTGTTKVDGPKTTAEYFSVLPGLSYDVNGKLSIQTNINVISIGLNHSSAKNGNYLENATSFNFGAGLSNIMSVNSITVGAILKF